MLINANLSLASAVPVMKFNPVTNYNLISDGDVIALDELEFKVMHTPGHTSGGVCYICGGAIFSGDTLFAGTVGVITSYSIHYTKLYDPQLDFTDGRLDPYPIIILYAQPLRDLWINLNPRVPAFLDVHAEFLL